MLQHSYIPRLLPGYIDHGFFSGFFPGVLFYRDGPLVFLSGPLRFSGLSRLLVLRDLLYRSLPVVVPGESTHLSVQAPGIGVVPIRPEGVPEHSVHDWQTYPGSAMTGPVLSL